MRFLSCLSVVLCCLAFGGSPAASAPRALPLASAGFGSARPGGLKPVPPLRLGRTGRRDRFAFRGARYGNGALHDRYGFGWRHRRGWGIGIDGSGFYPGGIGFLGYGGLPLGDAPLGVEEPGRTGSAYPTASGIPASPVLPPAIYVIGRDASSLRQRSGPSRPRRVSVIGLIAPARRLDGRLVQVR